MDYSFVGRMAEENPIPSFFVVAEGAPLESAYDTTYEPAEQAAETTGDVDDFEPLRVPFREGKPAAGLNFNPINLFHEFAPKNIVSQWVTWTNQAARAARGPDWKETTVSELYLWLGLVIYIGLHQENAIADY